MTRSPLFYPLNRGMDAEAGGVADLQTDVMRFIAILALCLVAIFALVQSIPLMPAAETPNEPRPQTTRPPPEPLIDAQIPTEMTKPERVIIESKPPPVPVEEKPLVITRPAAERMQARQTTQRIVELPISQPQAITIREPLESGAEQALPTFNEPVPTQTRGFTLRFETDLVLTRLVARNEVGLYAITPEKSFRMNVNRGSLAFWPASVPNQFHEMDKGTVPEDVLNALHRAGSVKTSDVKWGVTLPKNMRSDLDGYLREHNGGSLIIGGNGSLRLEP